ncbi:MAG TPA: GNAT family N-acetyltransferase [Ktedonobacteraceae bacterium]
MKKHLSIRDAEEKERSIIRDVTVAAYTEYQTLMPPRFWAQYQRNLLATLAGEGPQERIVAEQDGSIVGSVLLYPPAVDAYASTTISAAYPEVRFLAVLPQMRGQGIGNALMNACEQRARNMGAKALGLHTMEVMQVAMRMYERMGFVRVPASDFQPAEGIVVLGYQRLL